jgi:hypothetical protein
MLVIIFLKYKINIKNILNILDLAVQPDLILLSLAAQPNIKTLELKLKKKVYKRVKRKKRSFLIAERKDRLFRLSSEASLYCAKVG